MKIEKRNSLTLKNDAQLSDLAEGKGSSKKLTIHGVLGNPKTDEVFIRYTKGLGVFWKCCYV